MRSPYLAPLEQGAPTGPFTISKHVIQAVERHAHPTIRDEDLLEKVSAECPSASLREISRAALYVTTDPFPPDETVTPRLFDFAMNLLKVA
jgi:hypothetical protein